MPLRVKDSDSSYVVRPTVKVFSVMRKEHWTLSVVCTNIDLLMYGLHSLVFMMVDQKYNPLLHWKCLRNKAKT